MCKVFMMAGIKPEHQAKVKKLMPIVAKTLSKHDEDGVGYAAVTRSGKIYGEKWLKKDDAFISRGQPKIKLSALFINNLLGESAKDTIDVNPEPSHMHFGAINKDTLKNTVAMIVHARRKTVGEKCLNDTHPFYMVGDQSKNNVEDTAIIHNGTITNHEVLTKKFSSCDSEVILHEYLKNDTNYDPYNINKVTNALRGEYTVGVLSSYENGDTVQPILDIFKSKKELHVAYCPELETALFCTWKHLLEDIAKEAGLTLETMVEVKDDFLIRIDAITGKRLEDLIPFNQKVLIPVGESIRDMATDDEPPVESQLLSRSKVTEHELAAMKKEFEDKHPDLFNTEYMGGDLHFSQDEKQIFSEMERDNVVLENRAAELIRRVVDSK